MLPQTHSRCSVHNKSHGPLSLDSVPPSLKLSGVWTMRSACPIVQVALCPAVLCAVRCVHNIICCPAPPLPPPSNPDICTKHQTPNTKLQITAAGSTHSVTIVSIIYHTRPPWTLHRTVQAGIFRADVAHTSHHAHMFSLWRFLSYQ